MAVSVNSIWALVTALRMVMDRGFSTRAGREVFGGAHVSSIVGDFLKVDMRCGLLYLHLTVSLTLVTGGRP
jgi:hypothetical protein